MTRERLIVAGASALILCLILFRGATPIFPFDKGSNGVFFDQAARVLAGEVMYRDFFEFVGPGVVYLHALVLLVAGPSIGALTAAMVLQGAVLAVLVHALAARVCGPGWRLLPPAAFVVLVYAPYVLGDHKWPALVCALAGLLVLSRSSRTAATAFAGGCLVGGSAVFTQDLGAGVTLGVVVYQVLRRAPWRDVLALALGAATPLALAFAYFSWKTGAGTVLYDWLLYPLQRYPELNRSYLDLVPSLRTLPRELAQVALAAGGVAAAAASLIEWRRTRPAMPGSDAAGLVSAAGLGMVAAMGHRGLYPMGLAVQTCLLLPVLARGLERARGHRSRSARALGTATGVVVAVGILHGAVGLAVWRQLFDPMTLERHRAGAVWATDPMPELSWIEAHTAPGDPTFLMPAKGGHYFLSRTRNVTSFPYIIEGQNTVEQGRRALAEIEAARPRVGVWDQRPWPRGAPGTDGPLAFLYEGLLRSYDAETLPNGAILLRLKPMSGADQAVATPAPYVGRVGRGVGD
jgi:hypothetical protein